MTRVLEVITDITSSRTEWTRAVSVDFLRMLRSFFFSFPHLLPFLCWVLVEMEKFRQPRWKSKPGLEFLVTATIELYLISRLDVTDDSLVIWEFFMHLWTLNRILITFTLSQDTDIIYIVQVFEVNKYISACAHARARTHTHTHTPWWNNVEVSQLRIFTLPVYVR